MRLAKMEVRVLVALQGTRVNKVPMETLAHEVLLATLVYPEPMELLVLKGNLVLPDPTVFQGSQVQMVRTATPVLME